jgi:hypothetical protein
MKVICIDSSKKPAKISSDEWIEEGIVYTVVEVVNMGLQPGKLGLRLKEVQLSEKSFPYEYYDATRFLPIEGLFAEVEKQEEVVEETELDIV